MLIYLPENPTAAVEIATPSARNDGWWSAAGPISPGVRWLSQIILRNGTEAVPYIFVKNPPIQENRGFSI